MSLCWFEGKFVPLAEARFPMTDLAVQRGVGVFETLRTYDRRLFAPGAHLERLRGSAEQAGIRAGELLEQIPGIVREGLARADFEGEVSIRPYLTGGDVNEAGHFPAPRLFVIFEPLHGLKPGEAERGVALVPVSSGRSYPLVKSLNYLYGYIPRSGDPEAFETLYCPDGEITESASSNFFLCVDGKLVTAPVGKVLPGVTRGIVLGLAKGAGIKVEERCPRVTELEGASEVFLTGSVKEVLGVVRIGGRRIGDGRPGPLTRHLHRLYLEAVPRYLE
jgi:branched-chain amino acid aminotransferase